MEKVYKHFTPTKILAANPNSNNSRDQPPLQLRPLGGISLYNEHYQRHVQNKQNTLQLKSKAQLNQKTSNQQNSSLDFDQAYFEQLRIKEVMERSIAQIEPKNHNISWQIERIISDLRYSQLSTATLLEQIKKNGKKQEFGQFSSFQEIFQLYTTKNIHKFTAIMQRIEQELRRKFAKLLLRVKKEEEEKLRNQSLSLFVNAATQTHFDYHSHSFTELKKEFSKELDLKKIEYETLISHKAETNLNFSEPSLDVEQKLKKQQLFIKNLENIVKEKNAQLKRVQSQLKSVQDNLFSKVIQRKSSLKSELQSIQEDEPKQDIVEEVQNRLSLALKKKFRKTLQKRRAESVMVTTKNHSNSKLKEMLSSITDLQNYESKSMKEIKVVNNSQREKDKSMGNRFSAFESKSQLRKPSKLKKQEIKVPERYKNKEGFTKTQMNNQLWRPKKMEHFQKRFVRKSDSTLYAELQKLNQSKMSSQKSYNQRFTAARPSFQSNTFFQPKNYRPRDFKPRHRYSVQTKNQLRRTLEVNYSKLLQKETKKTHVSIYQNKQSEKNNTRVLKQVSFHLKNDTTPNFKIYSHQIDITIGVPPILDVLMPSEPSARLQDREPLLLPKPKYEKAKLAKSRLTKKTHFRVTSQLPSFSKQPHMSPEPACQSIEEVSFCLQPKENQNDEPSQGDYSYLDSKVPRKSAKNSFYDEKVKNQTSKQEENKIKSLAYKCRTKEQFQREFKKVHKNCGEDCQHLKKYLLAFEKLKSQPMRATIKMRVQNLNSHIKHNFQAQKSPLD